MGERFEERAVHGFAVLIDHQIGHATIEHDGTITWDALQAIKNEIWGEAARAVEAYPPQSQVVNNGHFRHLWLLGEGDFMPDLLGDAPVPDTLQARFRAGWAEACCD